MAFGISALGLSTEAQQATAAEIETEQAVVGANDRLIKRFEQKIHAAISRVWGDEG